MACKAAVAVVPFYAYVSRLGRGAAEVSSHGIATMTKHQRTTPAIIAIIWPSDNYDCRFALIEQVLPQALGKLREFSVTVLGSHLTEPMAAFDDVPALGVLVVGKVANGGEDLPGR